MNLPVGEIISQGLNLKEIDTKKLLEGFCEKSFSGYFIATLNGVSGIEEGALIFKDGRIVASFYEYGMYKVTIFGNESLEHVFNSFAAEYCIADVVSLSNQQVDLVTAFNDKAKLETPLQKGDIGKMVQKSFSKELGQKVANESIEKNDKAEIYKKLGLSELGV